MKRFPLKKFTSFGGYAFTEEAQALEKKGVNVEPSIGWREEEEKGVKALSDKIQADLGTKSNKAATA